MLDFVASPRDVACRMVKFTAIASVTVWIGFSADFDTFPSCTDTPRDGRQGEQLFYLYAGASSARINDQSFNGTFIFVTVIFIAGPEMFTGLLRRQLSRESIALLLSHKLYDSTISDSTWANVMLQLFISVRYKKPVSVHVYTEIQDSQANNCVTKTER